MRKAECIKRYGKAAYEKQQQQTRDWRIANPDKVKATNQVSNREGNRKGGKYYEHTIEHNMSGLPHERKNVRGVHQHRYRNYKRIIAPDSQIHHQWIPNTANYTGVALVEKDQHLHGFIDVIQILEGEITLLTEDEIRGGNNHV